MITARVGFYKTRSGLCWNLKCVALNVHTGRWGDKLVITEGGEGRRRRWWWRVFRQSSRRQSQTCTRLFMCKVTEIVLLKGQISAQLTNHSLKWVWMSDWRFRPCGGCHTLLSALLPPSDLCSYFCPNLFNSIKPTTIFRTTAATVGFQSLKHILPVTQCEIY